MPNPERGEFELTLGDRTFPVKASATALRAIEGELGPVGFLVRKLANLEVSVIQTSAAAYHLARAGMGPAKAPSREEIEDLVMEEGLVPATEQLAPIFERVIYGSKSRHATAGDEEEAKN